ncbi:ImuA family protein [Sphingobacterium faecale]|uniref:Error-prone repair protein ImuA n=1 Tax=Sphingobacterium faecale TaxID=2803775 RepID=A0ABS1QZ79_9SPHI|nr:Error-prone repair protein ImuA [Sphingobacterium faecale]MBL1407380.1 Error-prone repair protein ImuA [Sphingobacterium faecale]
MEGTAKQEVIRQLQEKILKLEGFKPHTGILNRIDFGLADIESAFPFGTFPTAAVHEFISPTAVHATATNGFIASIVAKLMHAGNFCLWISTKRSLSPIGLTHFGIAPHQIIFIDITQDKDALWVMEQALKCNALAAVVAEMEEVSFSESQRLQLAVEKSNVTGFLHRRRPRHENTLACVSRWKIRSIASRVPDGLPGVGYPTWEVSLEKVRNGRPGKWQVSWQNNRLVHLSKEAITRTARPNHEQYA